MTIPEGDGKNVPGVEGIVGSSSASAADIGLQGPRTRPEFRKLGWEMETILTHAAERFFHRWSFRPFRAGAFGLKGFSPGKRLEDPSHQPCGMGGPSADRSRDGFLPS